MGRSDTGMPARRADDRGHVERDGVRVAWESFGRDGPTVLLLPAWSIVHSRIWKAQVPYLARRFRVLTFDGRGNGLSDRPDDAAAYAGREFVADALAVLDATGASTACVVGLSMGALTALRLAVAHPDRVDGVFAIGTSFPGLIPVPRDALDFDEVRDGYEGWEKDNRNYWLTDYEDFLAYFFDAALSEPHSTKQREDAISWGLDTTPETLVQTIVGNDLDRLDQGEAEALCRAVRCPVHVVHGTDDRIVPFAVGARVAELSGGKLVTLEGAGHVPTARDPVQLNVLLRDFAERVTGTPPPVARTWVRGRNRPRRALFVSSPIGLGHAWRDVAIADELRRQVPGLKIEWLAQAPVTSVLRERSEAIHPASAELASEAEHIDREAGDHDLHAFEALRRMDEVLCANYMLFDDVVREDAYDVWIGDEAWEVDHFLHENPERKIAPYAWLTDFVGYLPMPAGGEGEVLVTADYNAEMIEHVERFPRVRDRAIFVGDPGDVVSERFGPGLPEIREWTQRHYRFCGYVPGFDPAEVIDRDGLRAALGYGPEPLLMIAVGGSGVGAPLLHRAIEALPLVRDQVPDLRAVAVAGPRIDPTTLPAVAGLETRGYVHELYRHLAACDVALVQGGLTTTMELVAAGRPFVAMPLASHFEQRFHVRHRLDRYGARDWLDLADADHARLAEAIVGALGRPVSYRPIAPGGAARAAGWIADLLG